MNRYEMSVFLACAELHGHHTGSGHQLTDEQVATTLAWLNKRIKDWQPSKPTDKKYDDAVKSLIAATIQEYL